AERDQAGEGTYNYRGNWNMLDQIIVSGALLLPDSKIEVGKLGIFREEWMMYKSDRNGWTPNRTYGGPNYYGGFSDHLPVYLEMKIKK
ncbi:MAG: endonuclease, partial [Bacteroidota bacterium]